MHSNNTKSSGRRVSFNGRVQVRRTEYIVAEMGEAPVPTWYTQNELQQMRKRQVKVMMSLDKVGDADKEVLKNVYAIDTFESKRERQDRVIECRSAVMKEQGRQWEEVETDVVSISESCQIVSAISSEVACERASAVAAEVERENKTEIDMWKKREAQMQKENQLPSKAEQLKTLEQWLSPRAVKAVQNKKLSVPHWKRRDLKASILAVQQPRSNSRCL
eukprot:Nitzschia sp. Nitz4//scaffold369_size34440//11541//12197//NITZ4_007840-RA/size34440-processed-gene-0.13-mRNA-1//1//CDS//3329549359//2305//frame0